jgi:hypothetical protein
MTRISALLGAIATTAVLTISSTAPSAAQVASPQFVTSDHPLIENVYWRHRYWHRGGGGAGVAAGIAAGALLGGALAAHHYYHRHYEPYYGPGYGYYRPYSPYGYGYEDGD